MSPLRPEYEELARAMEPLGFDVGTTLDIFRDRSKHGAEPVTDEALERLGSVINRMRIARAAG